MVRFSDLLGGNDDSEAARPVTASTPRGAEPVPEPEADADAEIETIEDALAALAVPEPSPSPSASATESPQAVLDRLTQYATSARAGDQLPDLSEAAPPSPDSVADERRADAPPRELTPAGDDLLPRSGTSRKSGRGRKRRP